MLTSVNQACTSLVLLFATLAATTTLTAQAPSLPPIPNLRVREIPPITLEDLKAQFPVNAQGSHAMEIPEILNSSEDKEVRAILSGRQVETVGEVISKSDLDATTGRIRIARAQMQCCAAHARACSIELTFSGNRPELKEGCWVKLTGLLAYEADGPKFRPLIAVTEIAEISAPKAAILK